MDILTLASLRQFAAHLLVEGSHHGIACVILQIRAIAHRDRSTLGITDTEDKHIDALLLGYLGSLLGSILVVLTIGDHDDGSTHIVLLGKTLGGKRDGIADIGTLSLDQPRCDILQEHLCRYIITGDRQLHEGIACKDNQSDLVVAEVIYQILYQHLALVETGRSHILGKHGIGDIETDHRLDAITLVVRNLASHLRASHHHDDKCQGSKHQHKLHRRTVFGYVGHQLLEQFRIAQSFQLSLSPSPAYQTNQYEHRYQPEQPEKRRIFKS